MNRVYAPGCALVLYRPQLAEALKEYLDRTLGGIKEHLTCCRHEPGFETATEIINTCAGCDRRYRQLYENVSTISLWELLVEDEGFPFPDYGGIEMTIHDACPTRTEDRVHVAVRGLLKRMNIKVVEAERSGRGSVCCGDSLYGVLPLEEVMQHMQKRADEMPCEDIVVYCVSCINAMKLGGKRPRYIVDLLFDRATEAACTDLVEWHRQLEEFISCH